jgi:hypothetical protein
MLGGSTMKLEKIITLANEPVRIRFLAMERSLRAVGCDLPLLVIPYDDRKFDLPPNATWWTTPVRDWLTQERAHRMMFKYQCLTTTNYQYVDTDIVFLRNPAKVLADVEGFITSCGHWRETEETVDEKSKKILMSLSTCWQRNVFNAGQFACDVALYTEETLKSTCHDPRYIDTCLRFAYHDQPGMTLLANLSGVPIRNLTMPPTYMESTWAEDYDEVANYEDYWRDESRKPYLIHWAGCDMWLPRSMDNLFKQYLTASELKEWQDEVAMRKERELRIRGSLRHRIRRFMYGAKAYSAAVEEYPS